MHELSLLEQFPTPEYIESTAPVSEDSHRKLCPQPQEHYSDDNADGETVLGFAHIFCCELVDESGTEQKDSSDNEIGSCPVHFIGELHRHQRHKQYEGYDDDPHN